jgi:hypothetical protein
VRPSSERRRLLLGTVCANPVRRQPRDAPILIEEILLHVSLRPGGYSVPSTQNPLILTWNQIAASGADGPLDEKTPPS